MLTMLQIKNNTTVW